MARVSNPEYVGEDSILNKESVGIDFINAISIIVEMIARLIEVPGCTDVAYIGNGEVHIRGFILNENSNMVGQTIRELQTQLVDDAFSIIALSREDKTFIPDDDIKLCDGDHILVLLATNSLPMFLPLVSRTIAEVKNLSPYICILP